MSTPSKLVFPDDEAFNKGNLPIHKRADVVGHNQLNGDNDALIIRIGAHPHLEKARFHRCRERLRAVKHCDSRFTVLQSAKSICPDLLSTRLLIMEATFLDNPERRMDSAKLHGHTHLDEIRQNASLFKSIDYLYLIHFSDRYSFSDIVRLCQKEMPRWLADRIIPSVYAKRCLELRL
ncbi:unnamed protein product [Trichobilharzia regenti]|nr:unnamed protein product [Trichobilharzia regenti]